MTISADFVEQKQQPSSRVFCTQRDCICSEIPITNATSSREWHPLDDLIKKGHKQMLVGFRLVNSSCLDQASNKRKLAYSTAEFPLCLCMCEESMQSLVLSVRRRQSPSPTWRVRLCLNTRPRPRSTAKRRSLPYFFHILLLLTGSGIGAELAVYTPIR